MFYIEYRCEQFFWNPLGCCEYQLTLLIPQMVSVLPITSTLLASSRSKKLNDIVWNLDFTIHLNFKNPTKLYVDICVYIFFTECVTVNKISIQSWMSYTINKIEYYYII